MALFIKKQEPETQSEFKSETENGNMLLFASDHAGFGMKNSLIDFAQEDLNLHIEDFGAYELDETDDYPDYIRPLAHKIFVSKGKLKGVILGGSGQGEAMVANRFSFVRAAVINTENMELVKLARLHNDANVLSFGARFISQEFAKEALKVFLETPFSEEEKHARRILKIDSN